MFGWKVIPDLIPGSLNLSPHGVGIAFGYFMGAVLMAKRARLVGYNEDHCWNGAASGVVGALIGARFAYVIGHSEDYSSIGEMLRIWEGGISLIGGLIGAFIAVFIYTRVQKISFFELVDLGAPGLGMGIALGRLGDLMIGDHVGKATSGWWGWRYEGGTLISPPACIYDTFDGCIEPGMVVHQTALYDLIWSFAIMAILLWLDNKPRNRGFLFLSWASLYAVGRIVTDFARVDKHWLGLPLTGSQLTSISALVVCLALLVIYKGVPRKAAVGPVPDGPHI